MVLTRSSGMAGGRPAGRPWQMQWWLAIGMALALLVAGLAPAAAQAPAPAAAPGEAGSYAQLADVLENDAARTQLIEQLRALSAETPPAETAAVTPPPAPGLDDRSLAARVGDNTQRFVADFADDAAAAAASLRNLFTGAGEPGRIANWSAMLIQFAIVAIATILAFLLLRLLAMSVFRRLDRWVIQQLPAAGMPADPLADEVPAHAARAPHPGRLRNGKHRLTALGKHLRGWYVKAVAMGLALIVDVAVILLAGAVGYIVATYFGTRGSVGVFDTLFINAFVAVEITRSLVRAVFATRFERLRLLPMPDDVALYWNRWLARVVGVAGYGLLVVVPVLGAVLAPAIGQLVGLIIMLAVYVYAVSVIWKNRNVLRERLMRRAQASSTAFFGTLLRMLARTWHGLAIAYFTVLLIASQIDPVGALPFMAAATVQTILAVGIGMLLSAILTALLSRRVSLGEDIRRRLPMLEARVNAYVPAFLKGMRLLILAVVALVVLDAWHAFNLAAWISSERGAAFVGTVIRIGIILCVAAFAWTVIASVIEHRLSLSSESTGAPSAREKTLLSLFRNAALIVIVTMTVLVLLSQIGIDIGPLIAGAGVVGLAIGFGAQKLVQDVITGVFIQLENGMNQNDVVEVAGIFGTVEKITIRSVGIRTLDGGYHMIPFSAVDTVSNHMRDFSYHWGEYTVAHRENVDDVAHHLREAFAELRQDEVLANDILEDITVAGVTKLDERGFTIRVLIKTSPGMQWAVQRAYNALVKKHFNAANIELPYPHTVVYFGQDKQGKAPAANVHTLDARDLYADGSAPANGAMHRPLAAHSSGGSRDVLGNELETLYDEEGNRKEPPAQQPERT